MGETVRVVPGPVEGLAARLDETGLLLSELTCRAGAATAALGASPAPRRLSEVGRWCDEAADALRVLVDRAEAVDAEAAATVAVSGLGGPWEPPRPDRNLLGEVFGGAWESLVGSAEAFNDLTVRALWDPEGWWAHLGDVGEGMVATVTDPLGAARAAVDVDTLRENPARWSGRLAPDLVAAALSGGALGASRRGVGALDDLADGAPTRGGAHHLAGRNLSWHAASGGRLDSFIATLPMGSSKKPWIRVLPASDLDRLIEAVRRQSQAMRHPRHPDGVEFVYPDGARAWTRHSDDHGLTLDVQVGRTHWKVHIDGS